MWAVRLVNQRSKIDSMLDCDVMMTLYGALSHIWQITRDLNHKDQFRSSRSYIRRYDMLCRIRVVQIQPNKVELYHSDRLALTGRHDLDHADQTWNRDLFTVKDTDHEVEPNMSTYNEMGPDLSTDHKIGYDVSKM